VLAGGGPADVVELTSRWPGRCWPSSTSTAPTPPRCWRPATRSRCGGPSSPRRAVTPTPPAGQQRRPPRPGERSGVVTSAGGARRRSRGVAAGRRPGPQGALRSPLGRGGLPGQGGRHRRGGPAGAGAAPGRPPTASTPRSRRWRAPSRSATSHLRRSPCVIDILRPEPRTADARGDGPGPHGGRAARGVEPGREGPGRPAGLPRRAVPDRRADRPGRPAGAGRHG
jgi:hypothetical protein